MEMGDYSFFDMMEWGDDSFFDIIALFADKPQKFPPINTATLLTDTEKWANLPKYMLFYILKFLNIRTDVLALRSVCTKWRTAIPLNEIPKLPLGFDAPKIPSGKFKDFPVLLYYTRFFLVSQRKTNNAADDSEVSVSPWIVRVADMTLRFDENNFELHNVLHGGPGKSYFHADDAVPPLRGTLNLLDCNVVELSSTYTLSGGATDLFNQRLKNLSEKIVSKWNLSTTNLLVMLAKLNPAAGGGLLFYEMGRMNWIDIKAMNIIGEENKGILRNFNAGDIVFYDGEFYAFDMCSWKIGIIDPSESIFDGVNFEIPSIEFIDGPKVDREVTCEFNYFVNIDGVGLALKGLYFVPSRDGLYLVFQVSGFIEGAEERLVVFVLDEKEREWNKVDSIGEQIFFIGVDVAFSTPAEALPNWRAGSICLFTRLPCDGDEFVELGRGEMPEGLAMLKSLKFPDYRKKFRVYTMGEDKRGIVPFEELSREVYTGLFFPPPPWVKWTCPSSDGDEITLESLKLYGGNDGREAGIGADVGNLVLGVVE